MYNDNKQAPVLYDKIIKKSNYVHDILFINYSEHIKVCITELLISCYKVVAKDEKTRVL